MQQAPGYAKLMTWTSSGIMSTPNAVGKIMETIAAERHINVLGVDIGGATTDVFSVFDGQFVRTVSANLGMSYSICNVLTEAGLPHIARWIPFEADDAYLRNQLRNKMIRPTTIPQTLKDLQIEQAVAREALRLAFDHHKSLARGLKGGQTEAGMELDKVTGKTLVNMLKLDMIVGSGGVLSHAPHRAQSALMMLDAYQPEGVTMLAVDSIFMMPQSAFCLPFCRKPRRRSLSATASSNSAMPSPRLEPPKTANPVSRFPSKIAAPKSFPSVRSACCKWATAKPRKRPSPRPRTLMSGRARANPGRSRWKAASWA